MCNPLGYADFSQVGDLGTVAVKVGEEYVEISAEAGSKVIDDSELFALMARSGAGIKTVDGLLHIDDGLFLNCR